MQRNRSAHTACVWLICFIFLLISIGIQGYRQLSWIKNYCSSFHAVSQLPDLKMKWNFAEKSILFFFFVVVFGGTKSKFNIYIFKLTYVYCNTNFKIWELSFSLNAVILRLGHETGTVKISKRLQKGRFKQS